MCLLDTIHPKITFANICYTYTQMKYPTVHFEKKAVSDGYQCIIGIDEAGRGSWAGPVVAAAVIFDSNAKKLKGITDSKLLSPAQREMYYQWITQNCDFGVGIVSAKIIDRIGIVPAAKYAMTMAIKNLSLQPDYLLIDAVKLSEVPIAQLSLIKGDQKSWSIAAASIVAKVTRDRLMAKLCQKYPHYRFDRHKGYGTALHQEELLKFGVSVVHRVSYRPVRVLLPVH
jgi:ribonuclease HII